MSDGAYKRLAAAVLVAHQQRANSSCLCGWGVAAAELGKSYAEHVAEVLDAAGALRDRRPR